MSQEITFVVWNGKQVTIQEWIRLYDEMIMEEMCDWVQDKVEKLIGQCKRMEDDQCLKKSL